MVIQYCFQCEFHEIRLGDGEQMSYCAKENCWSQFSKCVAKIALNRFLEQEVADPKSAKAEVVSA